MIVMLKGGQLRKASTNDIKVLDINHKGWHCPITEYNWIADHYGRLTSGVCSEYVFARPKFGTHWWDIDKLPNRFANTCNNKRGSCSCGADIVAPKAIDKKTFDKLSSIKMDYEEFHRLQPYEKGEIKAYVDIRTHLKNKFILTLDYGKKCNYDCSYCSDDVHDNHSPFLNIEKIEHLFSLFDIEYFNKKKKSLCITGGEPTLSNELEEVILLGKEYGFETIAINSNGTASKSRFLNFLENGVKLDLSIHREYANEKLILKCKRLKNAFPKLVRIKLLGRSEDEFTKIVYDVFQANPSDVEVYPIYLKSGNTQNLLTPEAEQTLFTKKPWCINPFIQFSHRANGGYRVCCVAADAPNEHNIETMSPLEFFNSEYMQTIRRDMLTGNLSEITKKACNQCITNARSGIHAKREYDNIRYGKDIIAINAVKKVSQNIESYLGPEYIRYLNWKVLGNLCNLKCIMCGPAASSKIAAELKKRGIRKSEPVLNPYKENRKEVYFDELKQMIQHLKKFILVGGESMIHPDFPEVFDFLSNSPNTKNLKLQITTNGTRLPDYVLERAGRFKQLQLSFSIDGVGAKGEYIRSDLDWSTFDTNIRRATDSEVNITLGIATQFANVGYLDEIFDYADELNLLHAIYWGGVVTEPKHLRAINVPNDIKYEYLNKLSKHEIFKYRKYNKSCDETLKILEKPQEDHNTFLQGIKYLKELDTIRNKCFADSWPEFKEYYDSIIL